MAGKRDFSNISVSSLKQQSALLTLRSVRKEGHVYVELRQDGKRYIFFCVLCHSPCYSDTVLFDHLRGHLHRERYKGAEVTLLHSNPWPFNDGVFFFYDSADQDKGKLLISDKKSSSNVNGEGGSSGLVIPGVLRNDQMVSLEVKLIGLGEIGGRILENDQSREEYNRIWCAWLGERSSSDEDDVIMLPEHDFGVVTFSYNYNLGRKPLLSDFSELCASITCSEGVNLEGKRKRKRKSQSEPEDMSQSLLSAQGGSSVEDFLLQQSKSTRRRIRREMRQQQRVAAERTCDICHIKLLPGKDVSCLLNMKTGRLACSSRNKTGAFHLFHTSCLLHWILLCEYEIRTNLITSQGLSRQSGRKGRPKRGAKQIDNNRRVAPKKISSLFCPECQGTGIIVEEDQLEKPSFLLSEMFNYKIKSKDAQRAWMKVPEILPNCSMGLHFPRQLEEPLEEKVALLKKLCFYRADESLTS